VKIPFLRERAGKGGQAIPRVASSSKRRADHTRTACRRQASWQEMKKNLFSFA
jgi:hypothetical protein